MIEYIFKFDSFCTKFSQNTIFNKDKQSQNTIFNRDK